MVAEDNNEFSVPKFPSPRHKAAHDIATGLYGLALLEALGLSIKARDVDSIKQLMRDNGFNNRASVIEWLRKNFPGVTTPLDDDPDAWYDLSI